MPVDILIPTYNPKREHLAAALESLRGQSFQDWRALVHDDASPSVHTEDIVKPFLADTRIAFKKSPTRLGIGGNWNECLKQTSGECVAYLFQDDIWSPDYLAAAIDVLQNNPSVGFVSMDHAYKGEGDVTNVPLYDAVRRFKKTNVAPAFHSGKDFLKFWTKHELHPNVIGEPSFVVMRRSAMEKAGTFLEDMPQFLDTEYWLRMLTVSDWYNLADREYGVFRVHPDAASAINQESGQGLFDRLHCFERLIALLQGEDRTTAVQARNNAIQKMVTKFRYRIGSGKRSSSQGSGTLVRFCLRHPFLILRSVFRSVLRREGKGVNAL